MQIAIGIEAGRDGVREAGEEAVAIAAMADVLAHHVGFGAIEHDQVAPAGKVRACEAVARVSSCLYLPWINA